MVSFAYLCLFSSDDVCNAQEPELVFVVGTAHFSDQSADDVVRVIEVRPDLPKAADL
jgi:pheromone shutdown protein TraB